MKRVLLVAAILAVIPCAPAIATEASSIVTCYAEPETPRADTDQLERLNEYLIWRDFELEPSATPATTQMQYGRRILFYYLTGARRPVYNGAQVYDYTIEIHQFATNDEAKTFTPYSTLLALDPVDLSGPGQLDKYLALHTQTYWNGNLALFMQVPPDGRIEPEDFAAAALVKERFIRDFLDYSDAAYEEERRVQNALAKVRQAIDLEYAEGGAIMLQVLDDYDQVDYASRLTPSERVRLDRILKEMISRWQAGTTLANEVLGQPAVSSAWVEPLQESLPLLVEYADSPTLLAFRRGIEGTAIDLMYRMDSAGLQPSNAELEAIRDALKMEMDSGQLREAWRIRNWQPAFALDNVRVYGTLAGAVVSPTDVPSAGSGQTPSTATIHFIGRIPMISPLRRPTPSAVNPAPRISFAVYLRKSEGRWVVRKIIQLFDAGWTRSLSPRSR